MSNYKKTVKLQLGDTDFFAEQIFAEYEWLFDGGAIIPTPIAVQITPLSWSTEDNIDPEKFLSLTLYLRA